MLMVAPPASAAGDVNDPADQWLPRTDDAEWTYQWSDSDYQPAPRTERYEVQSRAGTAFRLRWEELGTGPYDAPSSGTMDFRHTEAGLVNLNYQSTQPPPQFPILCASASDCGNSIAGALFLAIWGTRSPTLAEPLLTGTRWNSLGGASNDVASASRYVRRERISVPAFPGGVQAAKVESEVSHAGAIGDPFGGGVRTVWWVYGVGPVRIVYRHTAGEISVAELQSTTLVPQPAPPHANFMPLLEGRRATFRWRNSKHMRRWSRQRLVVSRVVGNTARVDVRTLRGPLAVSGSYVLSSRLSGLRRLSSRVTRGADDVDFPRLGTGGTRPWRFLTPYDLLVYGYNPVLPAHPAVGETWRSSRDTPDWRTFGVVGVSEVRGRRTVRTPAGRFRALVVRSKLRQPGNGFGSGWRTSWFAPGRGLVKLVFRHDDGSVSKVERIR
jgi:hypothetical protein